MLIRNSSTRELWVAVCALLLILSIDFFPCIFGQRTLLESAQFCQSILPNGSWAGERLREPILPKTLDPAAAAWFTEPSLAITGWQYRSGSIPLWNPYQGLGQPYAANMQSQPFFPLTALVSLHLTPRTYNLYLLSRLFLAGLGAYLFLRLFIGFYGALASGVTTMLGGYFLLYLSLPYLSVETLTPLLLYSAESFLRWQTRRRLIVFAVLIALNVLAGMPESSLLCFGLMAAFIVFRLFADPSLRRAWKRTIICVALGFVAGLCLSAFMLLPSIEFVANSYNTHEAAKNMGAIPGLWHQTLDVSAFTYLVPLLFGAPYTRTLPNFGNGSGVRNFWGVVPTVFALIAIASLRVHVSDDKRRVNQVSIFFAVAACLLLLKCYGCPLVNSVGRLPLLQNVTMVKYDEALLSLCMAALCGIGLDRFLAGAVRPGMVSTCLLTLFGLLLAAVFASKKILFNAVSHHVLPIVFPVMAVSIALSSLFFLAYFFWLKPLDTNIVRSRASLLGVLSIAVLTFEMSANYLPEIYYWFAKLPHDSENPYLGAPYIKWLSRLDTKQDRLFARDGILYPDWSAVFQLPDVRDLDAVYYWKYLPFVRAFMLPPGISSPKDEYHDRFTGAGNFDYSFSTDRSRRFLQLTSSRYLITSGQYAQPEFQLAYDKEVRVYTYPDTLSRASLFSSITIARDDSEALNYLTRFDFDVRKTAVLTRQQLGASDMALIQAINAAPSELATSAQSIASRPGSAVINTDASKPCLLMWNEAQYPGWEVRVDGREAKVLSADYLFQGVLLLPGKHRVKFAYRPASFRAGLCISLLTAAVLALWRLCVLGAGSRLWRQFARSRGHRECPAIQG